MLELRPNCELCDKDLPPHATDACICSYECTFCKDCVDTVLQNVCPNCGGGFTSRPVRPKASRRAGVGLSFQPASQKRVLTKYSREEIQSFAQKSLSIAPEDR